MESSKFVGNTVFLLFFTVFFFQAIRCYKNQENNLKQLKMDCYSSYADNYEKIRKIQLQIDSIQIQLDKIKKSDYE